MRKHKQGSRSRLTGRASKFQNLARSSARIIGHPAAFGAAVAIIVLWAAAGPLFGFSDTWQLVINTGTTIVTFLIVFLIQNTQNRDSEALQVKLDELIRATRSAHNALLDIEELSEEQLDRIREHYCTLARSAREELDKNRLQPFDTTSANANGDEQPQRNQKTRKTRSTAEPN